jgi:hypothetical protein
MLRWSIGRRLRGFRSLCDMALEPQLAWRRSPSERFRENQAHAPRNPRFKSSGRAHRPVQLLGSFGACAEITGTRARELCLSSDMKYSFFAQ